MSYDILGCQMVCRLRRQADSIGLIENDQVESSSISSEVIPNLLGQNGCIGAVEKSLVILLNRVQKASSIGSVIRRIAGDLVLPDRDRLEWNHGQQFNAQCRLRFRIEDTPVVPPSADYRIHGFQRLTRTNDKQIVCDRSSVFRMSRHDPFRIEVIFVCMRLQANTNVGEGNIEFERRGTDVRSYVDEQIIVDGDR